MSPMTEYGAFGCMFFGAIFGVIVACLLIGALREIRNRKRIKPKRTVEAKRTEFQRMGEWALKQQRMKSFIYETTLGDYEEIAKE